MRTCWEVCLRTWKRATDAWYNHAHRGRSSHTPSPRECGRRPRPNATAATCWHVLAIPRSLAGGRNMRRRSHHLPDQLRPPSVNRRVAALCLRSDAFPALGTPRLRDAPQDVPAPPTPCLTVGRPTLPQRSVHQHGSQDAGDGQDEFSNGCQGAPADRRRIPRHTRNGQLGTQEVGYLQWPIGATRLWPLLRAARPFGPRKGEKG